MRKTSIALVVIAAFALSACFEGDPEFSEAEQVPADVRDAADDDTADDDADLATVTFVAEDNVFTDAPTEVPAGQVRFELVNDGNSRHNVVLEDLGEMVVEADGGQTETGTITLDPGEYSFICDIPGHEQTMNGTITVSD